MWWVSGALKVIDPARTRTALRAYEILPHGLTGLVATALPLVEPALGTLLVGALGLDEWLRGRTATGRPRGRAAAGQAGCGWA